MEEENAKISFTLDEVTTIVHCEKEEKLKDICQKFAKEINKNINSLLFLYEGIQIDLEFSFEELVKSLNKKNNEMKILVYDKENNGTISQKNYEELKDVILSNNEIKDNIKEIKFKIKTWLKYIKMKKMK